MNAWHAAAGRWTVTALVLLAAGAELRLDNGNLLGVADERAEAPVPSDPRVVAELARGLVPTAKEAVDLAINELNDKVGVDAREGFRAAGLYRIGRDAPGFAKSGDLVWEVRVSRLFEGVSAVLWVSTTTEKALLLFPEPSRERNERLEPKPPAGAGD